MVLLKILGMRLLATHTGPLCPHAHSKLIFLSLFPLVIVFVDVFTVFPMGAETGWLGLSSSNIGAPGFIWDSGSIAHALFFRSANIRNT